MGKQGVTNSRISAILSTQTCDQNSLSCMSHVFGVWVSWKTGSKSHVHHGVDMRGSRIISLI